MSVSQYQSTVNSLDKEIASLEKKKADSDKKSADAQKKASNVSISKNASASTIKSKMSQINRYNNDAVKASNVSADLQKKIAEKRVKRNDAYLKLQKAQAEEQRKQDKAVKKMQSLYETRISELVNQVLPQTILSSQRQGQQSDDEEEYDVFVSHAWEDKESFADEFVSELESLSIKVWYDTKKMKWGDSMRTKIDQGLRKSKFGVVILSPSYIAEGKYWTKAELDGLFQMESINGKTLLPIWHELTKKDVMNFSPIIASKLAMSTAMLTPKEIAEQLKELLPENDAEE